MSLRKRLGLRLLKSALQEINTDKYYILVIPNASTEELKAINSELPSDSKVVLISADTAYIVTIGDK